MRLTYEKWIMILTLAAGVATNALSAARTYLVVDTGQAKCYDNRNEVAPPEPGQPFYGQDAQFQIHSGRYSISIDALTVSDHNTGLTWQRSPDTSGDGTLESKDKLTFEQARALPAKLNAVKFGGFNDWRLPSIKELYSLFDARGTDPSGYQRADTGGLTPFISTEFFKFAWGDMRLGERLIDSQYASSTRYVGKSPRGGEKIFGVNFADGRIKGYDLQMPGGRMEKKFYVQCVRGNPVYGKNDFRDSGNGTILDRATGLTWSKDDSGRGMNWQDALAWVQQKNKERYLGHNDWRMPTVKELQSIVDYTRSPDTTQSPAIDPLFKCTCITNEGHKIDYPFYWSGTTHAGFMGGGAAMYVAFGRAGGWMSARSLAGGAPDRRGGPYKPESRPDGTTPGGAGEYRFVDVHGAGSQRSDPKTGNPDQFPHGRGPQGDVIRIYNFVRCVRNEEALQGEKIP